MSSPPPSLCVGIPIATTTTTATTNIRVCVRCRPFIANELKDNSFPKNMPFNIEANSIEIPNIDPTQTKVMPFDFVFDENAENKDLYREMISDMIPSVIEGINVTTFAYGQTSSGKTFTTFLIRVSYLEIYNEKVRDLLSPEQRQVNIFVDKNKNLSFDHLTEEIVRSENEAMDVLARGSSHAIIAKTVANDSSSRSHTIFRMVVERKDEIALDSSNLASSQTKRLKAKQILRIGTLNLVDLAGSENASLQVDDNRKREGQNINLSLLHLKEIITKLSNGEKVSSFRNSKLTRILGDSLSGNASECDNALILKYQTELESLQNELNTLREKLKSQKDDTDKEETEEEVKNLENIMKDLTESMVTNKSLLTKLEDIEKEKRDRDARIMEIEKEKEMLEKQLKLEEENKRMKEEESRNKDQILLHLQQETLAMNLRLEEISLSKKEWESQSQRKEIQIKELMDYNRIIEEKMINEESSRKKAEKLVQDQVAQIELFKQKNELIAHEYAKEKQAKEEACNLVQQKLNEMQNIQHLLQQSENAKANYEAQLKILNDNMSTMYKLWKEDYDNEMRLKEKEKTQLDEQIARLTRILDEKDLEIRDLQEQLKTNQLLQQNILSMEKETQLYKKLLQEIENEKEMIKKKSLDTLKENMELKRRLSALEKANQNVTYRSDTNNYNNPSSSSLTSRTSRPSSPMTTPFNNPYQVSSQSNNPAAGQLSSLSCNNIRQHTFNLSAGGNNINDIPSTISTNYGTTNLSSWPNQLNTYNQTNQPPVVNQNCNPFNHTINGMRDDLNYQPMHHNPYQFYPPTNPSYDRTNSYGQMSTLPSNNQHATLIHESGVLVQNGGGGTTRSASPSPLTNRSSLSVPPQELSTNAGRSRPKLFNQQQGQHQPQIQAPPKVTTGGSGPNNNPIRNPSPNRIIRITGERASPKPPTKEEPEENSLELEQDKTKMKKRRSSLSNLFSLFKGEDKANLLK
nr:unnamed protein product [Naegleria fowleri]